MSFVLMTTAVVVPTGMAAAGAILYRIYKSPKIRTVTDSTGRPSLHFRMRAVGRLAGPVVAGGTKDLIALRVFEDRLEIGALFRRRCPWDSVAQIEPMKTWHRNALRLTLDDGAAWALQFYDARQLESFVDAARGHLLPERVRVEPADTAGPAA